VNENAGRYHLYFFIIAARLSVNIISPNGLSPWLRRGLSPAFHRVVYAAARPVELAARRNPSLLQRDLMQRDKPFLLIVPAQIALFFILTNGSLVFMIILFLFRRKLGHYGRRSLALA
jgi:hypothetical protein